MGSVLNLLLSIIGGVITYVIIEAFVTFMKKVAIPWYQKITYEGHRIDGEWIGYDATVTSGEYVEDKESESTVNLQQRGNKVTGELLLTKQPNGDVCRKIFEFNGSFIDTVLVLTVKAKDHNNMGVGTLLMKLTENGEKLKGKHTYISAHDWSTVGSREQVWIRKSRTEQHG